MSQSQLQTKLLRPAEWAADKGHFGFWLRQHQIGLNRPIGGHVPRSFPSHSSQSLSDPSLSCPSPKIGGHRCCPLRPLVHRFGPSARRW